MPVDGVRLTELIDASLRCAIRFSKEPIYNDIIRDINTVRLFKNILLFFSQDLPTENIVRLSVIIIESIASADLDGAYIIDQEGLEEVVIRLANHSNQKIGKKYIPYCS